MFDEILYADDTVCVSEDLEAMNELLKGIEDEGERYGMRLNYKKCELLRFGLAGPVRVRDWTALRPAPEVNTWDVRLMPGQMWQGKSGGRLRSAWWC